MTWRQGPGIKARVVRKDGTLTAPKTLATGATAFEQNFDLSIDTHDDAFHLLAFENAAGLQVRSVPSLNPQGTQLIEAGARGSMPGPKVAAGEPIDFVMFRKAISALIFFGKGRCVQCHSVAGKSNEMFSDFKMHVIGVPQIAPYSVSRRET